MSGSAKTHMRGSFTFYCKTATRSRSIFLPARQTSPGGSLALWLDASPHLNSYSVCSEHDGRWCRRSTISVFPLFFSHDVFLFYPRVEPKKHQFIKSITTMMAKTSIYYLHHLLFLPPFFRSMPQRVEPKQKSFREQHAA